MSRRTAPTSVAAKAKKLMRALHVARVGELAAAHKKTLHPSVNARLEALPEFAAAQTILFYWPVVGLGEVDFSPAIRTALKSGKSVCLPRIDWKTGRMTARRVRSLTRDLELDAARPKLKLRQPVAATQPVPGSQIDLILVPGVAFDRTGNRLGRGAGFYDRFLFGLPKDRPLRVALAFDEQISEEVVSESHDQPVHIIITPTETIRVRPARRLSPKARSGRNTRQAPSPTRARRRR